VSHKPGADGQLLTHPIAGSGLGLATANGFLEAVSPPTLAIASRNAWR
jgi:hypothetical protein